MKRPIDITKIGLEFVESLFIYFLVVVNLEKWL